jgi:hypothetical protein
VTEPVRLAGGYGDFVTRAGRFWQIGVLVALVAALVGLAVSWETPRVYRTRATVYLPAAVTNAAVVSRYAGDLQAAINSGLVRRDVAHDVGVQPADFGGQVQVRRIGTSGVMDVSLTSAERLKDPADALSRLIARAGGSLAAPDVAAAKAELTRAEKELTEAEQKAVAAKQARDDFLADRKGVPPASELAILGPELAQVRLCANGVVVPPGATPTTCASQLAQLENEASALAQADDDLAALDRDLAQAEGGVEDADRARRDAEAEVETAAAGPVVEVSVAGRSISRISLVVRRSVAIIAGAALLGLAVMAALAVLSSRQSEHHEQRAAA